MQLLRSMRDGFAQLSSLERSSCILLPIESRDEPDGSIELSAPPVVVGLRGLLLQLDTAQVLLGVDHGDEWHLRRRERRARGVDLLTGNGQKAILKDVQDV